MIRAAALGAVLAVGSAGPASAAFVSLSSSGTHALPGGDGPSAYDPQDLAGDPDPWSPDLKVGTGNTVTFGVGGDTDIILTYRGKDADYPNTFELVGEGGTTIFDETSARGDTFRIDVADFGDLRFFSRGEDEVALDSVRVAMTVGVAMSNVLEIGFNDLYPNDMDYDDMRVQAVVTPLPAALPLFASGLAGLGWYVRRRRATGA